MLLNMMIEQYGVIQVLVVGVFCIIGLMTFIGIVAKVAITEVIDTIKENKKEKIEEEIRVWGHRL